MLYSWNVSMTADGLGVAARCLLGRLAGFESTQLCAHGMTGLPLLAACIALGDGKYTGVAVRKTRKDYLSGRRIEGPLDTTRPVVIIDDSLSSGTALADAIAALEAEGATVEGAVVLVNFADRGGIEAAVANGYRVEALFDMERDLGRNVHAEPHTLLMPPRSAARSPFADALHPAVLARQVAEHFLAKATHPKPPKTVDGTHDGRGGVFVSFRRRDDDRRLARDGFWHFDPAEFAAPADIVAATIKTIAGAPGAITRANLHDLKIAVTFLGPLEQITPAHLDFDRWAIVVRDESGRRAGGALPNTQVFTSEVAQYLHAWRRNARIGPAEPHDLFRQSVAKVVEPSERWPESGAPDGADLAWSTSATIGRALTNYARSVCVPDTAPARPPSDGWISTQIHGVVVGIYRHGTLGTGVAWGPAPLADLVEAAAKRAARTLTDDQLHDLDLAVSVGVLHEAERLGAASTDAVARKLRKGLDALRVDAPGGKAVMMPGALVYNGWSEHELVDAVKSCVPGQIHHFTTYRTAMWLATRGECRQLRSGFPVRRRDELEARDVEGDIRALVEFTLRNQAPDGRPVYTLDAVSGRRTWTGTGARQLHALMALDQSGRLLAETGWRAAANQGFAAYLADIDPRSGGFSVRAGGPLADAIAVAAMGAPDHSFATHPSVIAARARLVAMFRSTGRIAAAPVRLRAQQDFEFLPGAVLVALATDAATIENVAADSWARALAWHRNRFHVLRSWGQVGWLLQGWAAVWRHQRLQAQADFVFELADWACDRQLLKNGAFLEELSPDEPSFNTGFIAEGTAAAWRLAAEMGKKTRARRYAASWRAANEFMRSLVIADIDDFCCKDPALACGGVRLTPSRADVRADSVSHWLNALVAGSEVAAS